MGHKNANRNLDAKGRGTADDAIIGKAFRWSLLVFVLAALVIVGVRFVAYWEQPRSPTIVEKPLQGPRIPESLFAIEPPPVTFSDITQAAGIDFVHINGAKGDKLLPETMGGGVAFFDYNNDGSQDLLFVNSSSWETPTSSGPAKPSLALYRNDGTGTFRNVTAAAGLAVSCYGMGVAVGDYDNDGWVDLFITALGENHLFHNNQGRFRDVTAQAGVAGAADAWSTGAAFFDIDNDGDLDLFVANYVRWSKAIDFEIGFQLTGIGRAYGPPTTFEGSFPYLYRNEDNGTFADVSRISGVEVTNPASGSPMAKALAVAPVDLDRDGWIDLFVANDTVQNFLFHNQGNGRFEEVGVTLGLAFDRDGNATGAMGADSAHFRNDGALGIAVGNFANEMTSFYVSQGDDMQFADEAITEGLGSATRRGLTFGLFFFDYDLDGWLDLFQANGHLEEAINVVQPSQHYAQVPQLFWNCGEHCSTSFLEVSATKSGALATPLVGRGASYADIDGDGDLDMVITQVGQRPLLLRNEQQLGHHWLRIKLIGHTVNRDGIGAWVEVVAADRTQRRQVMPTRSYLSQVELPITFGLGGEAVVDTIKVSWPNGSTQTEHAVLTDRLLVIEQVR